MVRVSVPLWAEPWYVGMKNRETRELAEACGGG